MLMQIDGTFVFVVISFLIFLLIIKFILFHPFTKIIDERGKFIDKNLKTEQESKKKAHDLIVERDRKIKTSRAEAGEIIKQTSQKAQNDGEKLIKSTKIEVQKQLEDSKNALEQESKTSKNELKNEVRSFVQNIVEKILNEKVDISIEQEKIEEYLKI